LKKIRAIELIEAENFGTSAQIMQEFYANATRKPDFGMTAAAALAWIEGLEELPCWSTDFALVKNAIVLSSRYRISYWDSAVLAAAEALGAAILYTEDLSDGQTYGAVQVRNPFLDLPLQPGFHDNQQTALAKD
jgi:predicted nucleic acid-binding protein